MWPPEEALLATQRDALKFREIAFESLVHARHVWRCEWFNHPFTKFRISVLREIEVEQPSGSAARSHRAATSAPHQAVISFAEITYLNVSGDRESKAPEAFSPFGYIRNGSVPLALLPGRRMSCAVFQPTQLPSQRPKSAALTATLKAAGWEPAHQAKAKAKRAKTEIFVMKGFEEDGKAIATLLGLVPEPTEAGLG